MKRTVAIVVLMVFLMAALLPFFLSASTASAQVSGYSIQSVDHVIEVMYSGHVIIRDTIHVTGQLAAGFQMGFPYKYGASVLKALAYDGNNSYPVSLGVPLENPVGFYGVKIDFGQSNPQVFTVVFVLSNSLISEVPNVFTRTLSLDFPAYPTFVEEAATCNVSIVLPATASSITITKDDGVVTTSTYSRTNLPAFTYSPASATFALPSGSFQIVTMKSLNRQITLSPGGEVTSSDSYTISNNSTQTIGSIVLGVPTVASSFVGRDESGRTLATENVGTFESTILANVTLASPLASGKSTTLSIIYSLPSASRPQTGRFVLNFTLFPSFDYYVDLATVTVALPDGARFITPSISSLDPSASLDRGIFQETLSISREGVSWVDYQVPSSSGVVLQVAYDYNSLWLSFLPTVWTWVLAVIGCIVVAVWRRPKPSAPARIVAPKASAGLSPDHITSFTEAYEEKSRIASELKSLEARAQKGRIPRRQYKVQRRNLELRSEALSKNISGLKAVFRSAGGVYADLVRQLNFAETELVEVETNMRTIEVRQSRGELSLEAYKKMLVDYQRRKEKAETTINGILLRLREETH